MAFTKLSDKILGSLFGFQAYNKLKDNIEALLPIGSVIWHYDFNGAVTYDTDLFKVCDGSTVTVDGTSRTLPDLSNRYIVGFGTEGGGDCDSATWSATPVGNASHQVDISHTHSVPGHGHSWPNTTSGPATYIDDMSLATAGSFGAYSGTTNRLGNYTQIGGVNGDADMTSGSGGSATQDIQPRSIRMRPLMRVL